MARQPRIQYEGACYHVMCRGDRQEPIFEDDSDRAMFLGTLKECCERSQWKIYAWVLMNNHYHWVLQTPEANLVEGMKWFQNTYTRRLNSRHKKWGHVFGGRYKAVVVQSAEEGDGDYLLSLIDYVHLNPVRAGLVKVEEGMGLLDYPWSSLMRGYAVAPGKREKWVAVREGLELFGYADRAKDRRDFVERLERRAREEGGECHPPKSELQNTLRRGWYWGSQAFRERLLAMVKRPKGNRNYRSSLLGRECERKEAEKWLEIGRKHFGITGPLKEATHQERIALAWALHRKTNQSQAWTAEALGLCSAANVSQQVRRFQKRIDDGSKAMGPGTLFRKWAALVKNC
jgi:REP-associated tyrosine transposase